MLDLRMALISKVSAGNGKKPNPTQPAKRLLNLALATEPNVPSEIFKDHSYLIYGEKGIGKTSLAAQFPGAYFLATEPGPATKHVRMSVVPDWDHFVGYVDLLAQENDPDITIVVDVIDLVYDFIYEKTCRKLMIESPTEENDFGATWRKIRKSFREQVIRILNTPGGKVFLSHDAEKEVELRDGSKVERVQPTMSKQAMEELCGLVNVIGWYGYDGDARVLRIKGHQRLIAKSQLEDNFLIKGGEPFTPEQQVEEIPMGRSPVEGYRNLVRAFDNEQETQDGRPPKAAKPKPALRLAARR